jgi:uncharacterized protein (TIGR02145 family)
MIQNSKEGTPSSKKYDNKPEGERGYYYSRNLALGACPTGWSLPSIAQWKTLQTYITGATESNEKGHWFDKTTGAGLWAGAQWTGWGEASAYSSREAKSYVCTPNGMGGFTATDNHEESNNFWLSVRCIKN